MTTLETRPPPLSPPTAKEPPYGAPPRRWKWTGDALIRMGAVGLLPHEGRFELLDGEVYQLMPPGPLHAYIVELVDGLLEAAARAHGAHAREQNPIRLSAHYDPQPDVAVVRSPAHRYRDRFPAPEDVLLLVEVMDSSVEHDRESKLPAYAAEGIRECWLVNLPEQQVEVYREPAGGVYRSRRLYLSGEAIEPLALPGTPVAVAELLGEAEEEEPAPPPAGE